MDPLASHRIAYLNTLRGVAALLVMLAHYGWVFFGPALAEAIHVTPVDRASPAWLSWMFDHPVNFGHFGVAIFFLVSGFVIPMSLGRLSGKAFLVSRFFRLWPTYAAAFTLSLIAFAALYSALDTRWPFTALNIIVAYLLVLRDLIGSPNIDGIVWTLEVEVKFYLLCAVCAPLFRRRSLAVFLLPLGLATLHTLVVMNAHLLGGTIFSEPARAVVLSVPYLIYMFVGTAFYYLHFGRLALYQAILAIVALYLLQLAVVMSGPVAVRIGEYWNYCYALILFAFAAAFPNLFPSTRMTDFVASISYPLYAVHNIVGYAIFRIMMAAGHSVAITLAVMTGVAIALAWILHVAIERPTRNLGRRIAAQIDSSREAHSELA